MTIDEHIRERLSTFKPLTDLVGTRIRPMRLDNDDDLPAVVYEWTGGGYRDRTMGRQRSKPVTVERELTVTAVADSYFTQDETPGAVQVAEQIRKCLFRWRADEEADVNGNPIEDVYLNAEGDNDEPDQGEYERELVFTVPFLESYAEEETND